MFRKELYVACKTNKALAMLCIETYTAHHHLKHIMQIWHLLGRYHKEAYKDYCNKLMGKTLTGEDEIFHSLYFAQKELYDKYFGKIPQRVALGDALGVAYKVLKEVS